MKKGKLKHFILACTLSITLLFNTNAISEDAIDNPSSAPSQIEAAGITISQALRNALGPRITEKELDCLARNIYHESYGEPEVGQKAIAYVTINRAKSQKYPETLCGVVTQRQKGICHFSWLCQGKWKVPNGNAFHEVMGVAARVIENYSPSKDPTRGATLFHSTRVRPNWNYSKLIQTAKIGGHVFYREL